MPKQLPQTGVQNTGEPVYLVDPATGAPTGGSGAVASQVQGNVAAAAADSGNPVKIGGVFNTSPAAVAAGQRTNIQTDSLGQIRAVLYGADTPNAVGISAANVANISVTQAGIFTQSFTRIWDGTNATRAQGDSNGLSIARSLSSAVWNFASITGGLTTTADTVMIAAGGAGVRNYCSGISFANSAATASEIVVKDGAATVLWRGYVGASQTTTQFVTFDVPLRGSANTDMIVAMVTAATATRVSAQGFQGI